MKRFFVSLVTLPLLTLLFFAPGTASAFVGSIVPCTGAPGDPCGTCEFVQLINNVIDFIIYIMLALAVILFVYAGFLMVTSAGNRSQMERGKSVFGNVLIGLVIILTSWLIVDIVMRTFFTDGQVLGRPWSTLPCTSETPLSEGNVVVQGDSWDGIKEDAEALAPISPTAVNVGLSETCNPGTPNFPNCASYVVPNDSMNPLFDCQSEGCSSSVRSGAEARMQETLTGPFATLQNNFGQPLVINDALAKNGTSRETETPGSRHFYGDALDISLAGLDNEERIRLFNEARAAGFTGFGFGNNILHIDRRSSPAAWAYNNDTYGGQPVSELINQAQN